MPLLRIERSRRRPSIGRILIDLFVVLFSAIVFWKIGWLRHGDRAPPMGKPHDALSAFVSNIILLAVLATAVFDLLIVGVRSWRSGRRSLAKSKGQ
jgi:hypothetical protein